MEAMRACLRELVAHWGLDPDAQAALSRAVTPVGQADWQRRILEAYPRDMLRQGKSASVPTRLIVGPDGRPTACKAVAEPSFEQATCANMIRYARFEPALDAAGLPVASYFITTGHLSDRTMSLRRAPGLHAAAALVLRPPRPAATKGCFAASMLETAFPLVSSLI